MYYDTMLVLFGEKIKLLVMLRRIELTVVGDCSDNEFIK